MKEINIGSKRIKSMNLAEIERFLTHKELFNPVDSKKGWIDVTVLSKIACSCNCISFKCKTVNINSQECKEYDVSFNLNSFLIYYSDGYVQNTSPLNISDFNYFIRNGYNLPLESFKGDVNNIKAKNKLILQEKELKEIYESGKSIRDCSIHFNCSPGSIRNYLLLYDIKLRRDRNNKFILDEDKLVELYTTGSNLKKCAAYFKCSPDVIKKRLLSRGIEITPTGKAHLMGLPEFFKENKSLIECAKHFNCSKLEIFRELEKLGL